MSDFNPETVESVETENQQPVLSIEDIAAWNEVGFIFLPDGTLNLNRTVWTIARGLTRRGHAVPRNLIGKPFEHTWWGPENFTASEIEAYFERYDVIVEHGKLRKCIAELVRSHKIDRVDKNTFSAHQSNL